MHTNPEPANKIEIEIELECRSTQKQNTMCFLSKGYIKWIYKGYNEHNMLNVHIDLACNRA